MSYLLCIMCDCFSQENTLSIAVLPLSPPPQFIVVFFNALCPRVRLVPCQELDPPHLLLLLSCQRLGHLSHLLILGTRLCGLGVIRR